MIERIDLKTPSFYNGLEDLVPEEMKPFATALISRLNNNLQSLYTDLTNQVVVDPDVLPTLQSGLATAGTLSAQTNVDVEKAIILGMMLSL